MTTLRIGQFEDTFVIHFGSERKRINAYTLASTLVSIADAARAANASLNPGYDIEVVVEALGQGSFKAQVRTIYREAKNLFSREAVKMIVLGVITNYIYQHTLAPDERVQVNVGTSEVVIEQGDTRIVVPRNIHDSMAVIERSPQFTKSMGQAIRAIEEDPEVSSLGVSRNMQDPSPDITIPRDRFANLTRPITTEEPETRELKEIADLEILRAILERSNRRWEFAWSGTRISAPVTDKKFYDDFFAHKVTIAPGDALRVRLHILQRRTPDIGVYINEAFEVVEVIKYLPRAKQAKLPLK